jgi:hypothetical protein
MYADSANTGFSVVRGAEDVREELTDSTVVVGAWMKQKLRKHCQGKPHEDVTEKAKQLQIS